MNDLKWTFEGKESGMRVGFIGLGSMGRPIAENVVAAGHDVVAWNRTPEKAKGLGAELAPTPADAARGAEVLVTMVSDDGAIEAVLYGQDGAASTLPEGAVHASMSTIGVACSRALAAAHEEAGQGYVACPVFGRPDMAQSAKLRVLAAGSRNAVERCRPLFEAVGQEVIELGETPEHANLVKILGNFLISSAIESMAEAFVVGRKAGLDADRLGEIYGRFFASPIYQHYGSLVAGGRFEPAGFKLKLGLKDTGLALAAADEAQAPMPVAGVIHDHYLSGVARGLGDHDWAALGRVVAEAAGLDG